jgi:hypothetical protein
MYNRLIEATLAVPTTPDGSVSSCRTLSEVVRCRRRLVSAEWREAGGPSVDAVLAGEVAYDVALIRYARSIRVDCDPRAFGWPHEERRKIEQRLESLGIRLR